MSACRKDPSLNNQDDGRDRGKFLFLRQARERVMIKFHQPSQGYEAGCKVLERDCNNV